MEYEIGEIALPEIQNENWTPPKYVEVVFQDLAM
jgi:hypothetical protein